MPDAGLTIVESFGMTETCGGCVYDGVPLPGVMVCTLVSVGGATRIAIAGPVLLTRYLVGDLHLTRPAPAGLSAEIPA